jgi:molecular chaperone GrpE
MSLPDRETLLRQFSQWLDQALAAEDPPRGIPEEILSTATPPQGGDLYSLQAALTALTQEVKLQGRSFKQLSETVAPAASMAPAMATLMEEARQQARQDVIDLLLDLRDRLARGEETAHQAASAIPSRPRWWPGGQDREKAAGIVAALREGYQLTAARMDEILGSFDVREIDCDGEPFDAHRMHAIGTEETDEVDEGTVVEVCRRGYEWNGDVFRPAQVRVARRPKEERAGGSGS